MSATTARDLVAAATLIGALAGCGHPSSAGADGVAERLRRCVDGRPFYFATSLRAVTGHRIGTVHAGTPSVTPSGDEGAATVAIPLDYELGARGVAAFRAAGGLCAPTVRCFPEAATAEIFPAGDGESASASVTLVDLFAPYRGGRLLALVPRDLHLTPQGGCG